MRQAVRRYKKYLPLRQLALNIVEGLPGRKNFAGQVRRIQEFVRRNIQYVRDVNGVETLQTPDLTIRNKAGDCDDQALLVAALLESIGHPTRFVAIKVNGGVNFCHVFTETKIGPRWLSVETTEDWPLGYLPRNITKRMTVHNR